MLCRKKKSDSKKNVYMLKLEADRKTNVWNIFAFRNNQRLVHVRNQRYANLLSPDYQARLLHV